MECPTCGQPIRIGSRLCPNCGAWLNESDGRPPQDFPPARATPGTPGAPGTPVTQSTPIVPTIPTGSVPTVQPPSSGPIKPTVPITLNSLGPPRASQRVDQPSPFGEPLGGSFPGTFPVEMPVSEPLDEVTTLSARRKKPSYWTITLPNGVVELVTDRLVIGRHPEFMPALPSARLIPVPDPTRSVSKNHACFSLYGANLIVEDLGSTNGIIVTRPDGHEHDIGVGGRTELEDGSRVELGDVVLRVGKV